MTAPRLAYRMREVAELTGASLTLVKGWCASGALPCSRPHGPNGAVFIQPADLEAFLNASREGQTVAPIRSARSTRRRSA